MQIILTFIHIQTDVTKLEQYLVFMQYDRVLTGTGRVW